MQQGKPLSPAEIAALAQEAEGKSTPHAPAPEPANDALIAEQIPAEHRAELAAAHRKLAADLDTVVAPPAVTFTVVAGNDVPSEYPAPDDIPVERMMFFLFEYKGRFFGEVHMPNVPNTYVTPECRTVRKAMNEAVALYERLAQRG